MRPFPSADHDNVAAEHALRDWGDVTTLRPGTIYGPHLGTRERTFMEMIASDVRRLPLPDGGTQIFHRVAVDRVGRAVAAAMERAPRGFWACNVVDPYDWDYSGLANAVAEITGWEWEPIKVGFGEADHPWQVAHPFLCSDRRLRETLGVDLPDPRAALAECLEWHRQDIHGPRR